VAKTIRHRGMTLTEKEHERWHREHPGKHPQISQADHDRMLGRAGGDEQRSRARHGARGERPEAAAIGAINPFAVGGAFLEYCVTNGWLRREGTGRAATYFVTETGRVELPKFGVRV
jgi:hypothetical protein